MAARDRGDRRKTSRPRSFQPAQKKVSRGSDKKANFVILRRTLFLMALFGFIVFVPLFWQLYEIQIADHEKYQQMAIDQQTMDNAVAANRGKIISSDGEILAMSATVYNIILSPHDFLAVQQNWDKIHAENPSKISYPRPDGEEVSRGLAEILDLEPDVVRKRLENTKSYYEILAKRVEKEVADEIKAFVLEHHLSNSVLTSPTAKRYYPKGSLAAQVIGWVNPNLDDTGAYGMEALYEEELSGQTGRVVTARDGRNREMKYSFQDYYDATDGSDVHVTIDTTIQYFCERILEKGIEMYDVQDGGFAIAMDPSTGAIKGWANSPTYDLNDPWTVNDSILNDYLEGVAADPEQNEEEYRKALGKMENLQWRNKAVNDTYEPGSTFKAIVLAAALEEGVVSEGDHFVCTGSTKVADWNIGCSEKSGHGDQTLAKAVANSCNPAFIAIGQRLGAERFYQYLKDFGMLEKTGVDMQGEGSSIIWNEKDFTSANGLASLATASFGQRFQITPLQLITGASAVINGGHLMQPYVMESIIGPNGDTVMQTQPTEVRQVVSEETSRRCRAILETVVDGGTGKRAYVPGYRIGGKTGSSETKKSSGDVLVSRGKDYTIVSFLGFAPADDPRIVVLLAYYAPKPASWGSLSTAAGYYISGGNMAAPMAGELLSDILDYMGVEKTYTDAESAYVDVTVPKLKDNELSVAEKSLEECGFRVRKVGEGDLVTAQIPAGGALIPKGSEVVLYLGVEEPKDLVQVPNVRGMTMEQARVALSDVGLYLKVEGSSRYISEGATVASQSLDFGTMVERGTVVKCVFSDNSMVRT